ncbi:MAG: hypothetical protein HQL98_07745 [Magnetococcales bacterium]|nr:hypothetical protein [Magnetococcales bacterium]
MQEAYNQRDRKEPGFRGSLLAKPAMIRLCWAGGVVVMLWIGIFWAVAVP